MSEEPSSRRSVQSAFVGRERELAELEAGLDDTRSGRGRFFLVTGEPGIGKSRLADELAEHAASRAMLVLRAGCSEGSGTPAYWSFIQLIRAALGGAGRHLLLKRLGTEYAPHVMQDVAQLVPELRHSVAAPIEPSAPPSPDLEQARFRLSESVAMAFKALAGIRPLMLVVEDLHDTDQPSLLMLRFVVRQLKTAPVLILGTYRDVEVQRSPTLSGLIGDLVREGTLLRLPGLGREHAAQMIEERAGTRPSPGLVADIHQATAGNPLFIDGLVRVLAAEVTLSTSRLDLAAFRVPDGVREAIRRWLALLSDRSILVAGATIGQDFESKCLQRVTQVPNHQLLDALREAAGVGVLTPLGHGSYRFSHALIRNALSEELDAADRAQLHLKIGKALEELYQADIEPHVAELARHFREAGDTQKAVDYSIRAGEAANAVFAYEQAVTHWQAALELMPEGGDDRERRADLLERAAELLGLTASDGDLQFQYLQQAFRVYEDLGCPQAAARVEARKAGWLTMRSYAADVSRALEDNHERDGFLGQDRDGNDSLVWRQIAEAAAAMEVVDIDRVMAASRRAMKMSEQLRDEILWARAGTLYANGLFASGQLALSFSLIDQVCNHADQLNDNITGRGTVALCCSMLDSLCDPTDGAVRVKRELAKPRMAEASLLRGLLVDWACGLEVLEGNLCEASGLFAKARGHPAIQGQIAFYQGEWERADLLLAQACDQARQGGRRLRACRFGDRLAKVRRALCQLSAAEAILHANLAIYIDGPHLPYELHTRQELALLYAETQHPEQAHPHLVRCREVMTAGEDWRGLAGHIARAEAAVAAAENRFEVADERFTRAVEIFHRYQVPFEEAETLHYWGRALLAAGDSGQALAKLDAATGLYQRHGAGERWLERVQADRLRVQGVAASINSEPLAAVVRQPGNGPLGGSAGERAEHAEAEGVFLKKGKYWTLSWAGSNVHLKDRKGLRCLAYLLRYPGQEFPAQALVSATEPGRNGSAVTRETAGDLNHAHTIARDLGDAGVALDATAKAQYKRRLEDLREELEVAEQRNDLGRVAKTRYEIEFINDQVASSIGLHGRDRKIASHAERSRIAATKSIKSALNLIREADAELARHLALSIKTGYFCAYLPTSPVNWRL
jgi:hypothetical protein